ncbi:peptidoglycan-binding protein [Phytohabitans flavus]|uniref:peptidoglycan-binding protein n=1 Tax=Phytohabitans flavus TaxID=1076124 RepID=UPI00363130D6
MSGTLDYGRPVTVNGRGAGVITWLPEPGTVISRGQAAYKADNRPVILFYGGLPLYRRLHTGDNGDDVRQVETNLAALGYTGMTVDDTYTAATAAVVKRWQQDNRLPSTGTFEPTDVIRAPAELRVTTLAGQLGDPASGPILTYTGTTRTVRIALDVALQGLVRQNIAATVTLPDGRAVNGTVTHVGAVATAGRTPADPATIAVTVTLADQSALGTLEQSPVGVQLVSARVENVLTVPVAALAALAEGGYGVQVVTGSTSRYVPVQLGMFANGRVQITGNGIAEGTVVGVPS